MNAHHDHDVNTFVQPLSIVPAPFYNPCFSCAAAAAWRRGRTFAARAFHGSWLRARRRHRRRRVSRGITMRTRQRQRGLHRRRRPVSRDDTAAYATTMSPSLPVVDPKCNSEPLRTIIREVSNAICIAVSPIIFRLPMPRQQPSNAVCRRPLRRRSEGNTT